MCMVHTMNISTYKVLNQFLQMTSIRISLFSSKGEKVVHEIKEDILKVILGQENYAYFFQRL